MAEICQHVLHEFGMPVEWGSIVVPIFKRKADIRNCSCYRAVKLFEHGGMRWWKECWKKGFEEYCRWMKCNLALCLREEQLMLYIS